MAFLKTSSSRIGAIITITINKIIKLGTDVLNIDDQVGRELDKKLAGKPIEDEIKNKFANVKKTEVKDDSLEEDNTSPVIAKAEKYVLCAVLHKKPYAFFKTDVTYLFSGQRREIYKIISNLIETKPDADLVQTIYNDYAGENQSMIVDIINYSAESAEDEQNEKKYYMDCLYYCGFGGFGRNCSSGLV